MPMEAKDWALMIASVGACVTSIIGAIFAGLASLAAARAKLNSQVAINDLLLVKKDVQTIEKATNSMKDALVDKAGKLGAAEGEIKGRADMKAEITLEQGNVPTVPVNAAIRTDIAAIPEKTSSRVVEKLKDGPHAAE